MMAENGKQLQMAFRNQEEQLLPSSQQTQIESFMPLATVDYFVLMIQVLGETWMYHGPKNIFHNILEH
jgi:hypothetical protein